MQSPRWISEIERYDPRNPYLGVILFGSRSFWFLWLLLDALCHHHLWHLESLSEKFCYRNQTNILILSWSNLFQKWISNPDPKKSQVSCRISNPDPVHAHFWWRVGVGNYGKAELDSKLLIPTPQPWFTYRNFVSVHFCSACVKNAKNLSTYLCKTICTRDVDHVPHGVVLENFTVWHLKILSRPRINVQECIFLGMQKILPEFDLAFPNNV